jgi:hypothetical protein
MRVECVGTIGRLYKITLLVEWKKCSKYDLKVFGFCVNNFEDQFRLKRLYGFTCSVSKWASVCRYFFRVDKLDYVVEKCWIRAIHSMRWNKPREVHRLIRWTPDRLVKICHPCCASVETEFQCTKSLDCEKLDIKFT